MIPYKENSHETYSYLPGLSRHTKTVGFLEVLSRNLWWCWKQDAITLFRRVEPQLWIESRGNPIQLLSNVSQTRLEELAADDSFLGHLNRVKDRYTKRVMDNADLSRSSYEKIGPVAYFSMEFGVNENIPIFAGGLGVLAEDYLKAASNMALTRSLVQGADVWLSTPRRPFEACGTSGMKAVDALQDVNTIPMTVVENLGNGNYRYGSQVPCELSGRYGFTARVTPAGDDYLKFMPNLITWS